MPGVVYSLMCLLTKTLKMHQSFIMSFLDNTIVDSKVSLNYKDNSLWICGSRFPVIDEDSAKYILMIFGCIQELFYKTVYDKADIVLNMLQNKDNLNYFFDFPGWFSFDHYISQTMCYVIISQLKPLSNIITLTVLDFFFFENQVLMHSFNIVQLLIQVFKKWRSIWCFASKLNYNM